MSDNPILVGNDGSAGALRAQRWAVDAARRCGAPIRVVQVLEWPTHVAQFLPGTATVPDPEVRREAEATLEETVTEVRQSEPDITVHSEVRVGPAAATLCEMSTRARMVVLGHRGLGGFTGLLLGSVGAAVSAHAHCPVVVVRGGEQGGRAVLPVMVGVDESVQSRLAVGFAFDEAASRGVGLVALRAWEPPPMPWYGLSSALAFDTIQLETAEQHVLDEALAGWSEKYPTVPVTTRLLPSDTGHALVSASHDAQLIVVGSRGRGGFAGMLLGSVSQQLLQHAHCPVAVVRETPQDGQRSTP